jgi:acetyl-CoA acetyltransferase
VTDPSGADGPPRRLPRDRRPVIAGLGITEMGRIYGRSAASLAAEAVRLAADDAGLALDAIDGLLVASGVSGGVTLGLQRRLGLRDLRLLSELQAFGATATAMVAIAAMAVGSGTADAVACVFADAPLQDGVRAGSAYARTGTSGWAGLLAASGIRGVTTMYALAARRHMERYGTTSEHLGAVAVAERAWAAGNPRATQREPITLEDHQASRWVAEPLHLLDCCLVTNGGVAVVVTRAERAADLPRPAVPVLGWAQCHPGRSMCRDDGFGLVTGAARSGPAALGMAGVGLSEVDVAELYDCYTYTVVVSLEDYGFCPKGEGGPFAASGAIAPGGTLALNTGGGQLSGYYMWGMTPLSEAVIQARGEGGERQAPRADVVLVSGNGGVLDHHGTVVLGGPATIGS